MIRKPKRFVSIPPVHPRQGEASLQHLAQAMNELAESIKQVDAIYEKMDAVSKTLFEQAILEKDNDAIRG